jgi:hypothetical protein
VQKRRGRPVELADGEEEEKKMRKKKKTMMMMTALEMMEDEMRGKRDG